MPVLAGSAAYAVGEAVRLARPAWSTRSREARGFYGVIAVGDRCSASRVDLSPLDPIKALVWSAVINGVIVVPIMVAMMIVASRPEQMGKFVATRSQRIFGWLTTADDGGRRGGDVRDDVIADTSCHAGAC